MKEYDKVGSLKEQSTFSFLKKSSHIGKKKTIKYKRIT